MPPRIRRIQVPPALAGERLDHVLDELVEGHSRAQLQKLVRRGRVRVGGKRVVRSNVSVGGRVEIVLELDGAEPAAPALRVLHEDEEILVVDKPAGLLTHPAGRSAAGSVAEELAARFGPLPDTGGDERPGIVHRLDRETSGLLVVARTPRAVLRLKEAFAAREVEKTYLALVSRIPPEEPFVIDAPVGAVPGKADRQMPHPPAGGKEAETEVELREAYARHALVVCRPRTGRRHQIRVHLALRGYPVLADPLYGTKSREPLPAGVPAPPRLALHAHGLAFRHPGHGRRVAFEAPLPEDLAPTIAALHGRARGET